MGVYAFFKIVTSAGDAKGLDAGKMTIVNAVIGFMVIKIAWVLVGSLYGKAQCEGTRFLGIELCTNAISDPNLSETARLFAIILSYINGFLFLIVVILIIYAGWLILSSQGDDKKMSKAKKIIKYILIGLVLVSVSILLFNFLSGRNAWSGGSIYGGSQ